MKVGQDCAGLMHAGDVNTYMHTHIRMTHMRDWHMGGGT